ncbi:aminotransferase [Haematobacter missouriensis]|uniref:Aspartate aminotransferase family protein n=1 Tax=Haematobacter missouriensis TaxID=366616 RepID=A0A212ATX1_9RHOB|nr:aspartate aminotransferase family protein [Haematobacter missouriensis]KFI33235.1 aminotransferase [Haematobacter missouriensis]OWJ75743.1 aspartate aminotransferase family protein [Haematobacter missouriensis]OWJ84932.1 aspartate aminotransferase family protein [Haematobacter missouriensis]
MSPLTSLSGGVPTNRLRKLLARETETYTQARPRSRMALDHGAAAWLDGVPMHWMRDWPLPFPIMVKRAEGSTLTDIDGHNFDDFCLGDTGSLFGHSPKPVAQAIRRQARHGLTYMLPNIDALAVGELLSSRFGEFRWQVATTATDANRFALKIARAVTERRKIVVFNGAYHGTVDETMVQLSNGRTVTRSGLVGMAGDPASETVAVEFNDPAALETALCEMDVAAVIAEPVMTNACMVLPEPGFHEALRRLTRATGTLLILDETHTISSGLGGYTRRHGLRPDIITCGKAVAGGVAAAVWGMTEDIASRFSAQEAQRAAGHTGMGTTLSGNPLQFAALRATLSEVMTKDAYQRMERGAKRLEKGLRLVVEGRGAPWHIARCGARVEFVCTPGPLRNGTEAEDSYQPLVEAAVHLSLVNRGLLIAPFHNMMLVSPVTRKKQIDQLIHAFDEICAELFR